MLLVSAAHFPTPFAKQIPKSDRRTCLLQPDQCLVSCPRLMPWNGSVPHLHHFSLSHFIGPWRIQSHLPISLPSSVQGMHLEEILKRWNHLGRFIISIISFLLAGCISISAARASEYQLQNARWIALSNTTFRWFGSDASFSNRKPEISETDKEDVAMSYLHVKGISKYFINAAVASDSSNAQENTQPVTTASDKSISDMPKDLKFEAWMEEIRKEAANKGLRGTTVQVALKDIKLSETIIDLDRNQPEFKLTAKEYLARMVSEHRISKGTVEFLDKQKLLEDVSLEYGIPANIIAAIWGIETSYGGFTGSSDVIQALVTLAYSSIQPGRARYFKEELFHALFILDQQEAPPSLQRLKGSWAGAMGQCQFMPSSYRTYAVDYDKDGWKDIWNSHGDTFASVANYLLKHGWEVNGPLAQKVSVPSSMDTSLLGMSVKKTVQDWLENHQLVPESGTCLPPNVEASLVAPDGPSGPAYLVCHNFRVLLRYNTSVLYGLAVSELANELHNRTSCELTTD